LLADRLIVEAILEEGLASPRHQELERELIRYAVPVLRQLLADGQIIGKATQLGRPPGGSEAWLDFTSAVREEFARDMVADALPVFTRAVFQDRRWSPARGASLKTYFVNACILQFAALYRKWLDQQRSVRPAGLQIDPAGEAGIDPAAEAALRDEASRVLKQIKDPQTREMLALRAVGYTVEDAARRAGLTPKAAEGRLARLRKALKDGRDNTVPLSARRRDTSQGGRWAQ
jgi:DNA-directed RNA polymerase specialized sigma24 family protein